MLYNPYFTQILNPAYLDVIECPYLNYTKSPSDIDTPDLKKQCSTVPEQNVSDFIDALKYDWESLPKATKDEYYSKLAEMMQDKNVTENFEGYNAINTAYPNENALYIVYALTILGFILYFLYCRSIQGNCPIYLAIYLIILVVGTGLYYFSHI